MKLHCEVVLVMIKECLTERDAIKTKNLSIDLKGLNGGTPLDLSSQFLHEVGLWRDIDYFNFLDFAKKSSVYKRASRPFIPVVIFLRGNYDPFDLYIRFAGKLRTFLVLTLQCQLF
ncbi:hypothetical protein [Pedobacter sp. V48]|uniref:hypothetical protein n=1 Tax=Pedobacter sp. V48 TaxID=509635 RepID=UPI0003E54ED6|nr:hypothetical protein [Pedobacter sp. V48]ETZ20212.1 hypothetical protein N824_08340 [Pedobacter sp. V48]